MVLLFTDISGVVIDWWCWWWWWWWWMVMMIVAVIYVLYCSQTGQLDYEHEFYSFTVIWLWRQYLYTHKYIIYIYSYSVYIYIFPFSFMNSRLLKFFHIYTFTGRCHSPHEDHIQANSYFNIYIHIKRTSCSFN